MSSTHAYTPLKSDNASGNDIYVTSSNTTEYEQDQELEQPSRWSGVVTGLREFRERNVGLLLIVAAQVFFTLMNLSVKTLNSIDPPVTALQLIVVRMLITYVCSVTYMLATGVPDPFTGPKGVRLLLVFRGISGFFGLLGIYFSLQYLSLSDATVLTFLAPLCTAFSGAIFLGEYLSYKQALAGVCSLIGVILIARPPFIFGYFGNGTVIPTSDDIVHITAGLLQEVNPEKRMLAVLVALVGVLGATGAYTALRAIGKRAHPLHSLVSFSSQSVVGATIGMIITKQPFIIPARLTWLAMLITIGIFGFVAQILLTMGLARETVSRGSMAIYTQIVFATIFERVFFHTSPSLLSMTGTLLIISSALYVALMKKGSGKAPMKDSSSTSPAPPSTLDDEEGMERGLLESRSDNTQHRKYNGV